MTRLAWLCACASVALAACADTHESVREPGSLALVYDELHSAFDDVHDYRMVAIVDQSLLDPNLPDPIVVQSAKWHVDDAYLTQEPFEALPLAVLLTTRRSGTTLVTVEVETRSGRSLIGHSQVSIDQASAEEWTIGSDWYERAWELDQQRFRDVPPAPPGFISEPQAIVGCTGCHGPTDLVAEYTPLQTAGYSDQQLIDLFCTGARAFGGPFVTKFLSSLDNAQTYFESFHHWPMPEEAQRDVVYKLRSIAPEPHPELDAVRLRAMR